MLKLRAALCAVLGSMLALGIGPVAAQVVAPTTYLKITATNPGYSHFKIGDNPANLWFPQVSPATGHTAVRLWLRNFGGVDWSKLALVAGNGNAALPIGNYVSSAQAASTQWFQVDLPLSAFAASAFTNISALSMPWSQAAAPFILGLGRIEFVGGPNPRLWYGPGKTDNIVETPFTYERVVEGNPPPPGPPTSLFQANPQSGGAPLSVNFSDLSTNATAYQWSFPGGNPASSAAPSPSVVYATAGSYIATQTVRNAAGQTATSSITITVTTAPPPPPQGGLCPPSYYAVESASASSYNHFKLAGNPSSLWFPQVSPAAGQTHLRLVLRNVAGVDWSKMVVAPNGDTARGVNLAAHVANPPANQWFEIRIPLSAFPANAFANITNISVPWTINNSAFTLGVGRVEFVGGAAPYVWYGAPEKADNLYESPFSVRKVVSTDCGNPPPPGPPTSLFVASTTSGQAPLTVNFADRSTNATSFQWSFPGANPASATVASPSVTYTTAGSYIATQTVRNAAGQSASSQVTITVTNTPPPPPPPASGRTFGNFVGTNILLDTPVDPIREFKHLRMYVPSEMFGKFAGSARDLAFQPSDGWLPTMDNRLLELRGPSKERDVMLVIQGSFPYQVQAIGGDLDLPPVAPGANSTQPSSYADLREACYQFAARYGRANPGNVSVRAGNQPRTGLDAIGRFEPRNEVYAWWKGGQRTFTKPDGTTEQRTTTDWAPEEEVAMLTACAQGARAADPSLPIAAPGSTGWDKNQLARGKNWLNTINGGQFPVADYVVNLYWNRVSANVDSNYRGALDFQGVGVAPEFGIGLYDYTRQVVAEVKSKYPNANVVVGEFGWDTEPTSWQEAPGTTNTDSVKQQGQWLVRGLLQMFAGGADRVYQYLITGDSPGLFESSGITTRGYGARLSWYYVVGAIQALRDAEFVRIVDSGRPDVSVYEFRDASGKKYWALWTPTANNTQVSGYRLQVGANNAAVSLRSLTNGERGGWNATPFDSALTTAGDGTVAVNVSETPVFVVATPR